jgi:hypothetical protein
MNTPNSIYLSLVITFRGEDVQTEDQKQIAQNVLNALVREINNGGGLAPEDAEYLTESIKVTNATVNLYSELL